MFRRKANATTSSNGPSPTTDQARPDILDQYVRTAPSAQNSLDLFEGEWSSALPPAMQLKAGPLPTYDDDRIHAVVNHIGSIRNFKILELGPLEAGHSYMLHEAGADVTAIEGSSKAFLKCLVVKEILNLDRAHFQLGDFVPYLEQTTDRFDLVVASGVLYHMIDPLRLLELIAGVTDRIAIWTHYWDHEAVAADEKISRVFLDEPVAVDWRDTHLTLHPRHYREALGWGGFCGGPETSARWMERDGLIASLTALGFTRITVLDEEIDHVNGPTILLCAER